MSSRSKRHHKSPVTTTALVPLEQEATCPGPQPCETETTSQGERPLPNHEAVAARAREIWEARGCPSGQDLEIWFAAEGELFGRSS